MVLTRPLRSRFARVPPLVSTLTFLPLALKLWVFPFAVTLEVPPAGRPAPLLAVAPPALPPAAVPGRAPAAPPALALAAAPPLAPVVAPAFVPAAPPAVPGRVAAEVPGLAP